MERCSKKVSEFNSEDIGGGLYIVFSILEKTLKKFPFNKLDDKNGLPIGVFGK
jgi:hypothetical protein